MIDVADRRYPDTIFDHLHIVRFAYSAPPIPFGTRHISAEAKLAGKEDGQTVYLPETLRYHTHDFATEAVKYALEKGEATSPEEFLTENRKYLAAIDARHDAGDISLAEAQAWFEYCMGLLFTMNGTLEGFGGVE